MKTTGNQFNELEHLVSLLLDDVITLEKRERLELLLRANASARVRYAELVALESMLHWEFADAAEEVHVAEFHPIVDFSTWLRPVTAMAACLVAALAGWLIMNLGNSGHGDGNLADDSSKGKTTHLAGSTSRGNEIASVNQQLVTPALVPDHNVVVLGPSSKEAFASTMRAASGVDLVPHEREALIDAAYGVAVLESGQGFGEGGFVEVTEKVTAWRTDDDMRVGTEFGVQPFNGLDMLRFSRMEVDVFRQQAEVSELVRVLDVRPLVEEISDNKAVVKSAVLFNQGVGIADAGTEFALSLHAIDREGRVNVAVGREETQVMSDVNPTTWERVESEIELPEGTDFVVVALSARKEGSQALLPDLSGHYADGLEIAMAIDGRSVYGRL